MKPVLPPPVNGDSNVSQESWDQYLEKLCKDGYVYIPQFLEPDLLKNVCAAVDAAFDEAPFAGAWFWRTGDR